jgi:hypothetical protein
VSLHELTSMEIETRGPSTDILLSRTLSALHLFGGEKSVYASELVSRPRCLARSGAMNDTGR